MAAGDTTEHDAIWRRDVDQTLTIHAETLEALKHATYGYWEGNVRSPGILEQNRDLLVELKSQRDDMNESFEKNRAEVKTFLDEQKTERQSIKSLAWSIGRPVIVAIGIVALLSLIDVLAKLNMLKFVQFGAH